ncbi:hypothetical protein ACQ4M3_35290 [Leptolyngbya sp. AN03gr2]|uniref:hypothetical protein n=1 Tax=unclassified Leptolyngbya TaxID=2650499 RepID=UPI003D31C743
MITHLYRQRRYSLHGVWRSWYEPCPIIRSSNKFFIVQSVDYPETPLYAGGKFQIDRRIESTGKVNHTRHGEWFFLEPQADAFLFPSQDVLAMPDYATVEANKLGWDISVPVHEWHEWQRQCWLYATLLKVPLRTVIDRWKHGGESAFNEMLAELQKQQRSRFPNQSS